MTSAEMPSPAPAAQSTTSAAAAMKLIEDQLAEERATKSSLEARAIGVITSSGALATLLFALAALVTKPANYAPAEAIRILLVATLAAFMVAIIQAILASRPGTYQEVSLESLYDVATRTAMGAPAEEGGPEIARMLVTIVDKAREQNAVKARFLRRGVTAEAVAAGLLALAIALILLLG